MIKEKVKNIIDKWTKLEYSLAEVNKDITLSETEYKFYLESVTLISTYIEKFFNDNIDTIKQCITTATEHVFGIKFKMEIYRDKANRVSVKCVVLESDAIEYHGLFNSNGGGLIDLISLFLRIIFIAKTDTSKIFIVDEPFRNVSDGYKPTMIKITEQLSEQLGIQIIMPTHDTRYVEISDKIYAVGEISTKMQEAILEYPEKVTYIKKENK